MGWKHTALSAVRRLGGLRLVEAFYGPRRLTVLAYHRIADPRSDGFVGFQGNASATPAEFEAQMEWIADRMNPVGIDRVAASLDGGELPDRPVLVTFDDGYRDNLSVAAPVVERHGIEPTIFLATDHVGTARAFWWDRVAAMFTSVGPGTAELPILGLRTWHDAHSIASDWITAAKRLPEGAKLDALSELDDALGRPPGSFEGVLLSWEDVGSLQDRGWSIGAHTCSHPILTRLPAEDARSEISGSIDRVRQATGSDVTGFAYPNGLAGDFDDDSRRAVRDAGVPLAFTLVPGPARPNEVAGDPLAVRRVYVHHGDDPVRFAAKASGVPRLVGRG